MHNDSRNKVCHIFSAENFSVRTSFVSKFYVFVVWAQWNAYNNNNHFANSAN